MVRTQIQLSETQVAALKQLSALHHTSMAELIRRAVDLFTSAPETGAFIEQKQRALNAAGKFHSGISDVSTRHDEYLTEAFK
jgi:Ribbon-helix-helix protein, copG family